VTRSAIDLDGSWSRLTNILGRLFQRAVEGASLAQHQSISMLPGNSALALSGTVIEQWLKEIYSAVQNDSRRLAVN